MWKCALNYLGLTRIEKVNNFFGFISIKYGRPRKWDIIWAAVQNSTQSNVQLSKLMILTILQGKMYERRQKKKI